MHFSQKLATNGLCPKRLIGTCLVAGLLIGLAGSAKGAIYTESYTKPETQTQWTQGFNLNKFDSAYGTLVGVTYRITANLRANYNSFNNNPNPATETVVWSGLVVLTPPALPPGGILSVSDSYVHSYQVPGLSSTNFNVYRSGTSTRFFDSPTDLAQFLGGGTLAFSATADSAAQHLNNDDYDTIITTYAGITFEIDYEYSPAPEASTIIAAAGLLGICLWQGRKYFPALVGSLKG